MFERRAARRNSSSDEVASPGAIAPPTNAPDFETQSNVVAVPRSTTMHGAPWSVRPASALAIRSGPTESGSVTWSGIGEPAAVTSSASRPEIHDDARRAVERAPGERVGDPVGTH